MLIKLFQSSAVYGLGAVAMSAVSFLLLPVYTRHLSPAAFGQLETLTALGQILLIGFALGVGSSFFAVHFRVCQSEAERSQLLTTALFVLLAIAGFQAVLAWIAAPWLSGWLHVPVSWLRLVIVTQLAQAIGLLPFAVLRSRQLPHLFVLLSVCQVLGLLGLNLYHVTVLGWGVPGVLRSQLLVHGLTALGTVLVIVRRFGLPKGFGHSRLLCGWGMRHVPDSLASWTSNLSDRYFLLAHFGTAPLGVYALGYKLGMVLQVLLVMPLAMAWPPFVHQAAERADAATLYARSFKAILILALGFWVVLGSFAREWVQLIGGPGYEGAQAVMPVVLLAYVLATLPTVFSSAIVMKQRYNWKILIGFAVAGGNLGLNAVLIPVFGTQGAAWATVLTFLWQAVLTLLIAQRLCFVPYALVRGGCLLLLAGTLVFTAGFVQTWGSKLLLVAAYPLCVWCCGLWPRISGNPGFRWWQVMGRPVAKNAWPPDAPRPLPPADDPLPPETMRA